MEKIKFEDFYWIDIEGFPQPKDPYPEWQEKIDNLVLARKLGIL
jgi:hypothetical protein